jgi:hypothetical protein
MLPGRRPAPPLAPGPNPAAARSPAPGRAVVAAVLALAALAACESFRETTSRHFGGGSGPNLFGGGSCPDETPGQAAGADSAEAAFRCFRKAVEERSTDLMLRVTCQGRSPSSCKHNAETKRSAQEAMNDLAQMAWRDVVARWPEADNQTEVYAVDTYPREKRVSTVKLCRIVEKTRWAVCEIGEMPREAAERKGKSSKG